MTFHITLSPMRRDDSLTLHRAGDVLTINGQALDFSALPEGGVLDSDQLDCDWIVGDVRRQDGVIQVTLILPHGPEAPAEVLFPAPITIMQDGSVALPEGE